jgi:hypothetical protein
MGRFLSKVPTVSALLALALISPLSLNQEAPPSTETLAGPQMSKQVALQGAPLTSGSVALTSTDEMVAAPQAAETPAAKTISSKIQTTDESVPARRVKTEKQ